MTKRTRGQGHLPTTILATLLALALIVAAPMQGVWQHTAAASDVPGAQAQNGADLRATCAEGAVNGLITVSIAATLALFVPITLPTYPVLLGTGLGVGCTVRIVGERLKEYALPLWQGHQP